MRHSSEYSRLELQEAQAKLAHHHGSTLPWKVSEHPSFTIDMDSWGNRSREASWDRSRGANRVRRGSRRRSGSRKPTPRWTKWNGDWWWLDNVTTKETDKEGWREIWKESWKFSQSDYSKALVQKQKEMADASTAQSKKQLAHLRNSAQQAISAWGWHDMRVQSLMEEVDAAHDQMRASLGDFEQLDQVSAELERLKDRISSNKEEMVEAQSHVQDLQAEASYLTKRVLEMEDIHQDVSSSTTTDGGSPARNPATDRKVAHLETQMATLVAALQLAGATLPAGFVGAPGPTERKAPPGRPVDAGSASQLRPPAPAPHTSTALAGSGAPRSSGLESFRIHSDSSVEPAGRSFMSSERAVPPELLPGPTLSDVAMKENFPPSGRRLPATPRGSNIRSSSAPRGGQSSTSGQKPARSELFVKPKGGKHVTVHDPSGQDHTALSPGPEARSLAANTGTGVPAPAPVPPVARQPCFADADTYGDDL